MDEICDNNMSDIEIANRMRKNNYEKFKTLVRMHLSFELDLNTDEFDLPSHEVIYYEKGKLKRWNRLSKKLKTCSSGKCTTSPSEANSLVLDYNFIKQLEQLKMFILLEKNVIQEGIFRKTGSVSRQNELRALIQNDKPLDLNSGYTVHDCATVFKSFLADLQEPVLTDAHYPAHCQIAPLCNTKDKTTISDKKKDVHLLSSMQLLLLLLPEENRALLQNIIEMLHVVATHEETNKMSSENLATLFAPHLICPRHLPPEALHYVAQTMSAIITYMVTKGLVIFEIPAKLATDIRAYFLERKRKKTMSPEQTLDESISDISTVNTIYTFVDREKTAAAHNANNTDTELAQLYAHIQSLPESSKKRRLIKQFNKQNGQGTPLQLVLKNRIKNPETSRSAKSISDSIKRHIFHKGIISRTPKRTIVPLNGQVTPNFSTKNPKLRVLFQSPVTNASPILNTSGTSSSSSSSTNIFSVRMHPLQKSISSTSLLLTHSSNQRLDSIPAANCTASASAPVSRTTSSDLESSFCVTPMKQVSNSYIGKDFTPAASSRDKKSVLWKDNEMNNVTEISNPLTPISQNQIEYQLRYKSEPNLSRILKERVVEETPISKSESLKRKLIKGVSMGNLKFPFVADSNGKPGRSVSLLKRQVIGERCTFKEENKLEAQHNLDEEEEEEEEDDYCGSENDDEHIDNIGGHRTVGEVVGCSATQRLSNYRNIDLITSTPSMSLGRRSMSPITKSTQRMPKAMQESIMTPRSRKPVMLTTTQGSSEQNQTLYQSDLSSFREEDEDSFVVRNFSEIPQLPLSKSSNKQERVGECGPLSNDFKDYLLSRSVLTASPEDSSFSSQPDDFGSTQDIEDLNESQLSASLLYCLDGNQPVEIENPNDNAVNTNQYTSSKNMPIKINRKRTATGGGVESKEMCSENIDSFLLTKKLFITEYDENPGETSF